MAYTPGGPVFNQKQKDAMAWPLENATGSLTFRDDNSIKDTSGDKRFEFTDAGSLILRDDAGVEGITLDNSTNTHIAGTLTMGDKKLTIGDGDFEINTNKFTVAGASGDTVVAGTLTSTGLLAASADATVGTTLGVTGISTLTGGVVYGTETKTNGALTPAIPVSIITIDGTKAYGLADGATAGTIKHITVKTVANTPAGTLTPTTTSGAWLTAAFSVVGQSLTLLWDGAGWAIVGRQAGVAAITDAVEGLPVIAE